MARILVVDDESIVRETVRRYLERAGHEVDLAPDGQVAERCFRERPCDLVVTDILMPEREGLETIMTLRRAGARVPIIAISGGGRVGNFEFLAMARHLGADATLAKPFRADELLRLVDELLGAGSPPAPAASA